MKVAALSQGWWFSATCRLAQAFDLACTSKNEGGPSFGRFAKGGSRECLRCSTGEAVPLSHHHEKAAPPFAFSKEPARVERTLLSAAFDSDLTVKAHIRSHTKPAAERRQKIAQDVKSWVSQLEEESSPGGERGRGKG